MSCVRYLPLLLAIAAQAAIAKAPDVRDADERTVEACRYLEDVQGKSGWGGAMAAHGINGAKKSARKKAAKLGATHIVWGQYSAGGMSTVIHGRAYDCESGPPISTQG